MNIKKYLNCLLVIWMFALFTMPVALFENVKAQTVGCPDGDTSLCADGSWRIKCYLERGKLAEPEEISCPSSLESQKNLTKCFKVKDSEINPSNPDRPKISTEIKCPDKISSWNIKCFNSSGESRTCPIVMWESSNLNKCYKITPGQYGIPGVEEQECPVEDATPTDEDQTTQENDEVEDVTIDLNPAGKCDGVRNCITPIIKKVARALVIGFGVIVAIMMIVGGIQYMAARENPQEVQSAKSKIYNAVIAIFVYIFIFAFMQWLIPGGLFS